MRILFYPGFFILIYSVQTSWLGFANINGATPDLVLIFAFFCGVRFKGRSGVAAAGLAGFVQDCLSGSLLGVNTLSKSLIGFLVSAIRKNILVENFVPIAFFTTCASFMDGMIFYFISPLFMDSAVNENVFFNTLPIFALYNALAGPPIFYFLDYFQSRMIKKTQTGFLGIS